MKLPGLLGKLMHKHLRQLTTRQVFGDEAAWSSSLSKIVETRQYEREENETKPE